jgi:hypothetical protein
VAKIGITENGARLVNAYNIAADLQIFIPICNLRICGKAVFSLTFTASQYAAMAFYQNHFTLLSTTS